MKLTAGILLLYTQDEIFWKNKQCKINYFPFLPRRDGVDGCTEIFGSTHIFHCVI